MGEKYSIPTYDYEFSQFHVSTSQYIAYKEKRINYFFKLTI